MSKSTSPQRPRFPFRFEKNGRTGKIYRLGNGNFKTYFRYAGGPKQNTHSSFDAAYLHLDREFSKLDTNRANSLTLHPLDSDVRTYRELEQLLKQQGNGASLREAVQFFLAHRSAKRFEPRPVSYCKEAFLDAQRAKNVSAPQLKTLKKHLGRFERSFGPRKIHELSALQIGNWLGSQQTEQTGDYWGATTRRKVRGSLVSMALFSQRILNAIPDGIETEFQKVENPKPDSKPEVDIYSPSEMSALLLGAVEHDLELIPALVVGGFEGLRPYEFHAEGLAPKRFPLSIEAFNWNDLLLHVKGQKVRSKATRDIQLHPVAVAWMEPLREMKGSLWPYKRAFDDRLKSLRKKAGIRAVHDGLRHSYASYRIRHLKGDLAKLAEEMGNSPKEIVDSYKRNVTDTEADTWFGIRPPAGYANKIRLWLRSRKAV